MYRITICDNVVLRSHKIQNFKSLVTQDLIFHTISLNVIHRYHEQMKCWWLETADMSKNRSLHQLGFHSELVYFVLNQSDVGQTQLQQGSCDPGYDHYLWAIYLFNKVIHASTEQHAQEVSTFKGFQEETYKNFCWHWPWVISSPETCWTWSITNTRTKG